MSFENQNVFFENSANGCPEKYGINLQFITHQWQYAYKVSDDSKKTTPCRLLVSDLYNWLCSSPAGIVSEEDGTFSLLEIKCPYSCRNKLIFEDNLNLNVPYLKYDETIADIVLLKGSEYYTQIQIGMLCTDTTLCHLFVYSYEQQIHVKVKYDNDYVNSIIPKVSNFYFRYYLPQVVKHE